MKKGQFKFLLKFRDGIILSCCSSKCTLTPKHRSETYVKEKKHRTCVRGLIYNTSKNLHNRFPWWVLNATGECFWLLM